MALNQPGLTDLITHEKEKANHQPIYPHATKHNYVKHLVCGS